MQRTKIGVLVIVILVIVAAIFGWREYSRKNEPVKDMAPAIEVSASQIIKEFDSGDSSVTSKYIGKLIAVNGTIRKIDKDHVGFYTIVLGAAESMSSVRCAMDSLFANEVLTLHPDETITIKGMFTGFQKDDTGLLGSDIILNRGVVDIPKTKKQD